MSESDSSAADVEGSAGGPVEVPESVGERQGRHPGSLTPPDHVHEWSIFYSTFGPYGEQDAHFHVCLTENPHPAPGFDALDCYTLLVGPGRACSGVMKDHGPRLYVTEEGHEVRDRGPRIRHG